MCSRGRSKWVSALSYPSLIFMPNGRAFQDLLHIQRQSAYLIGRDRAVVDIAVDHPSCSKQHAVIQCASHSCTNTRDPCIHLRVDRQVQEKNEFGEVKSAVK